MAASPPNHASYICIMPLSNFLIIRNTYVLCLVTQLCPTLCNSMDCSLPGSSVLGIFQARILEWVAISFSSGSFQPRDWTLISCIGNQVLYHWATREAEVWVGKDFFKGKKEDTVVEIEWSKRYSYLNSVRNQDGRASPQRLWEAWYGNLKGKGIKIFNTSKRL